MKKPWRSCLAQQHLGISIKVTLKFAFPDNQTPWQEISRKFTGQLSHGACLDLEENYFDIANLKGIPRDSH